MSDTVETPKQEMDRKEELQALTANEPDEIKSLRNSVNEKREALKIASDEHAKLVASENSSEDEVKDAEDKLRAALNEEEKATSAYDLQSRARTRKVASLNAPTAPPAIEERRNAPTQYGSPNYDTFAHQIINNPQRKLGLPFYEGELEGSANFFDGEFGGLRTGQYGGEARRSFNDLMSSQNAILSTDAPFTRPTAYRYELARPDYNVLSLVESQQLDSILFNYYTQNAIGSGTEIGVDNLPEGGVLPNTDLEFTLTPANMVMIGHSGFVPRPAYDSQQGLADILRRQFFAEVERELGNQIITGDGTGNNFTGLLDDQFAGIETVAAVDASSNTPDTLIQAFGAAERAVQENDHVFTAALLSVGGWNAVKTGASTNRRIDFSGDFTRGVPRSIDGVPVVTSNQMPSYAANAMWLVGGDFTKVILFMYGGIRYIVDETGRANRRSDSVTITCFTYGFFARLDGTAFAKNAVSAV